MFGRGSLVRSQHGSSPSSERISRFGLSTDPFDFLVLSRNTGEGRAMTWYPDLSNGCMAGHGDDVRAVGWLSGDQPYPVGDTAPGFIMLLESHVSAAWQPFHILGLHTCDLDPCAATVGPSAPVIDDATLDAAIKKLARE